MQVTSIDSRANQFVSLFMSPFTKDLCPALGNAVMKF